MRTCASTQLLLTRTQHWTLKMPNLSGKHARWWTKVYRSGIDIMDLPLTTEASLFTYTPHTSETPTPNCKDRHIMDLPLTTEASLFTYAPHISETPTPNCRGRHHGPAIDHHREQAQPNYSDLKSLNHCCPIGEIICFPTLWNTCVKSLELRNWIQ